MSALVHHFGPVDFSDADLLVTQRQLDPDAAARRAIEQRIEALRDIAATTWRERDLFTAGASDFERRREQRRRAAIAAELRDLRRVR